MRTFHFYSQNIDDPAPCGYSHGRDWVGMWKDVTCPGCLEKAPPYALEDRSGFGERAQIVAWLRSLGAVATIESVAAAIERGDHWRSNG